MSFRCAVLLLIAAHAGSAAFAQEPAVFVLTSDWDVRVALPGVTPQTVHIAPPLMIDVKAEKYGAVPIFNPKAGGWIRGAQLSGVKTQETTHPHLLAPESFRLRAGPEPDALLFTRGLDYEIDLVWGTFGRLANSRIETEQPVYASYRHAQVRLDAIALEKDGQIVVHRGEPGVVTPVSPPLKADERHLGNIYLPALLSG